MRLAVLIVALFGSGLRAEETEGLNPYLSPAIPAEASVYGLEALLSEGPLTPRQANTILRRMPDGELIGMPPALLEKLLVAASPAVLDRIYDRLPEAVQASPLGARLAVARIVASRRQLLTISTGGDRRFWQIAWSFAAATNAMGAVGTAYNRFWADYVQTLPFQTSQSVVAAVITGSFCAAMVTYWLMGDVTQKLRFWEENRALRRRVTQAMRMPGLQHKLVEWADAVGCPAALLLSNVSPSPDEDP